MAPWDVFTAPLRSLLGVAEQSEHEVVSHTPLHETAELEAKLEGCVTAIHRSTDSLEQQIAVLEKLADSLAPLTESVTRLTDQLEPLLQLARPLGAAEQRMAGAEREVLRAGHLLGRHRDAEPTPPPARRLRRTSDRSRRRPRASRADRGPAPRRLSGLGGLWGLARPQPAAQSIRAQPVGAAAFLTGS